VSESAGRTAPRPDALAGRLRADDFRVALIVSRFNSFITDRLLDGALDVLSRMGAPEENLTVVHVPGAMEIPPLAAELARSGKHDAVVCLGAVIRGATTHFDHVSMASVGGASQVALEAVEHGVAVTVGIITTENLEQAIERAGSKAGNKGAEAATAAIEVADLLRQLGRRKTGR